jgi:hypothetical protein
MRTLPGLGLVALLVSQCSAGLLYGVNVETALQVGTINLPNASLHVLATSTVTYLAPSQLIALGTGTTAYTLSWNESTNYMDLVGFNLLTAVQVSRVPTNLPEGPSGGFMGVGQEIAFIPPSGEVAVWGQTAAADTPWTLQAISPTTGVSRVIQTFPADALVGFLGNGYRGFDAASNRFQTPMRNRTGVPPETMTSLFIDVTTGDVRTQIACLFTTMELDPQKGVYTGFAVFNNGSTLDNVYKVIRTIPADGSGPCSDPTQVVYDEGTMLPYVMAEGTSAFDSESRRLFAYLVSGDQQDSPALLLAVNVDTGVTQYFGNITAAGMANTLVVSGMCDAGALSGCPPSLTLPPQA